VEKIKDDARRKLVEASSNPKYGELVVGLIVQGLIRLQDSKVMIRVRKEDVELTKKLLSKAAELYISTMKRDTGLTVSVDLSLDETEFLSPAFDPKNPDRHYCTGGVVLVSGKGRIVIDNTLDRRLELSFEELKPIIRKLVFPSATFVPPAKPVTPAQKHHH
jgi:V-type H+-transporting ATPase subunit E